MGNPARPWSETAIRHLLDTRSCPVCEQAELHGSRCLNCGAELSGGERDGIAAELWDASRAAVAALTARQEVLGRVPTVISQPDARPAVPATAPSLVTSTAGQIAGGKARASATLQSVLATAGASLFAIAAIVFTFLNPDLTDHVLRSLIVGIVTLLFLGGAWLLARRSLKFSAEAVGALGMVFVALDVYALSELTPAGLSPWVLAAVGALVASLTMIVFSSRVGIRSWLWIALLGVCFVPAMLGYAGGTTLSATVGYLGVAFAALAALELTPALGHRFGSALTSERISLASVQIVVTVIATGQLWFIESGSAAEYWVTIFCTLTVITVLAVAATRQQAKAFWSLIAGSTGVAALVFLSFALNLDFHGTGFWYLAIMPAAAAAALLILNSVLGRFSTISRNAFSVGAFTIIGISAIATVLSSVLIGAATVLDSLSASSAGTTRTLPENGPLAVVLGLAALAIGFVTLAVLAKRTRARAPLTATRSLPAVATWVAALAALTLACLPPFPVWLRITLALGLAAATGLALVNIPRLRSTALGVRVPLVIGAHFAVLLATVSSWPDDRVTVLAGIPILVALALIARAVPAAIRFLHVGVGYAYALVVIATGLNLLGAGMIVMFCLTTAFASLGAITVTFIRRVPPTAWYAVLTVTAVPFLIGVLQTIFERSGWTALSTGTIFLLAATLLVTRRVGLGVGLRAIAAGILVPSLAVVVVCLGAQLLEDSASPVTLPVIAALVALVLPSTEPIRNALLRRGIGERDAAVSKMAIEATALLTGAIAILLALVRVAAGLQTTFLVLVILGLGATATALLAKRDYGWWVAGAAFTGALWCQLALAGVGVLEPYLLPPSIGAAVIGAILSSRGHRAAALYATGLVVSIAPILIVLAVFGNGDGALAPWRSYGLVAASWLLLGLGLGAMINRVGSRMRALRTSTLLASILAGAAGMIQGVRFGLEIDPVEAGHIPLVLLCLGIGAAGALPSMIAANLLNLSAASEPRAKLSHWYYAPAALYLAASAWTSIEADWFTIWTMWALMLAYLCLLVVLSSANRVLATKPRLGLPVWFVFCIAFITAIVAWSPRELRVEWFSLPLGLALIVAGALSLGTANYRLGEQTVSRPSINGWPNGWRGSWALLTPGIVTIMLASIISTFTDPLTWRAILVIVFALIAILIGSSRRLAAPFVIGIIVLPIENLFVFLVQIGRGIESMPWWTTLAVVGAVLLIIAVTYERRSGEEGTIAARMRDLR